MPANSYNSDMNAIGQRIRQARLDMGYETQEDFAAKTGLNQKTLSTIETGRSKNPTITKIIPIARALHVSLEWLVDGQEFQGRHNSPTDNSNGNSNMTIDPLNPKHYVRSASYLNIHATGAANEAPYFNIKFTELITVIDKPVGLNDFPVIAFQASTDNLAPEIKTGETVIISWRPIDCTPGMVVLIEEPLRNNRQWKYMLQRVKSYDPDVDQITLEQFNPPLTKTYKLSEINRILPKVTQDQMMGI